MRLSLFFFLAITAFTGFVNAQEITWNDPVKKQSKYFYELLPVNESETFSVSTELGASIRLIHYSNNVVDAEQTFKLEVDGKKYDSQDAFTLNGNLVFIFFIEENDQVSVYSQLFDKTCKPTEKPRLEFTYSVTKKQYFRDLVRIRQSENLNYLCIINQGNYYVYDDHMNLVTKHKYGPSEDKQAKFVDYALNNSGTIIFSYLSKVQNMLGLLYVHAINEQPYEVDINVQDDLVYNPQLLKMNNRNNFVYFVGGYSTTDWSETGVFNISYDLGSKSLGKPVIGILDKEFLTAGRTTKEKKYYEKLAAKGKRDRYPGYWKTRDVVFASDNTPILIYEHYNEIKVERRDSKTNMVVSTTYYYHYDDVVIAKFDVTEGFEWLHKIVKRQKEVNFVYDSGIAVCDNESEIFIFFNDNLKNYSEEGRFIAEGKDINPMLTSASLGCLSCVTLNKLNGNAARMVVSKQKETKLIARPMDFMDMPMNGMLKLYAANRFTEKFGFFKY